VIVLQINFDGIVAIPTKGDAPISTRIDSKPASAFPLQAMKAQTWLIHGVGTAGGIEREKNAPQSSRILNTQPGSISSFRKTTKAFAAKGPDHPV
jgi:hypothetical protein